MPPLPPKWKPWHLFQRKRFRAHPAPLLALVGTLQEAALQPQPAHQLVAELDRRGMLRRCYTQNIDGLEEAAGTCPQRLVYVHGRLPPRMEETGDEGSPAAADATRARVAAVEQHIAFIGDAVALPQLGEDLAAASVLLVMGTSFTAATAADIAADCPAPRILVTLPGSGAALPPRRAGGRAGEALDDCVVTMDAQDFARVALLRLRRLGQGDELAAMLK